MTSTRDRLWEFGNIGAGHAATALARLVDRTVWMDPPRGRMLFVDDLPLALFPDDEPVAGVFVDLGGAVEGVAGLLLPLADLGKLLQMLPGSPPGDLSDPRARSAFAEIGNIALCAAAGAIAKLSDGLVVPSVPRVGVDMASALLTEVLHPSLRALPAYLVESELTVGQAPFRLRFVWVPLP